MDVLAIYLLAAGAGALIVLVLWFLVPLWREIWRELTRFR